MIQFLPRFRPSTIPGLVPEGRFCLNCPMKSIFAAALLCLLPILGLAAEPGDNHLPTGAEAPAAVGEATAEAAHAGHTEAVEHEGLSSKATEIFTIPIGSFKFPVTNSMFVTWIVAIILILFVRIGTRQMKDVPDGAQNFWEFLVEGLYNFIDSIVGSDLAKKTFWFFLSIFIFILFTNWFGLIPGVGTIGWGHQGAHGFVVTDPLLRGGNADLNMTLAMSAIFMVLWLIWALQSNGIVGFVLHLFGPKGESTGFIKYMMIVVFFCVGFLEIISIAFRPVSLSFRLYGNIFAGENLLEAMSNVVKEPAWAKSVFSALLPVPFYFMELLVGLVQAFVFMLLTTVFTALICTHDESHEKGHGHAH
jgi:F-type H+-transporting ATPase subunit a